MKPLPFTQTDLARRWWDNPRLDDCPIYDVHGHMGAHGGIYMPLAEPDAMARHLARIGGKLVFTHHWALFSQDFTTHDAVKVVQKFPEQFRTYIAINPHYPQHIAENIAAYDSFTPWAVGFKCLSGYHKIAMTDKAYAPMLEFANERRLPVLIHTWGGCPFDGEKVIHELIGRYPHVTYLLAHAFNGHWNEAIALMNDYPDVNAYLELTSIPGYGGVVEKLVAGVGSHRILYGTDLPWFDEYQAVGGILGTHLDEDSIRNILYRNAQKIFPEFMSEMS